MCNGFDTLCFGSKSLKILIQMQKVSVKDVTDGIIVSHSQGSLLQIDLSENYNGSFAFVTTSWISV